MFGTWVLNEIWITDLSSVLIGILVSSSKLLSFFFSKEVHLNSSVRLLLELYCVVVFFTIWTKLTVAFTCTSLRLNLYTVFGCGCGFRFEQNFGGSKYLAKKRHGSSDLHTPTHSPSLPILIGLVESLRTIRNHIFTRICQGKFFFIRVGIQILRKC